jgi:hypothetical protein
MASPEIALENLLLAMLDAGRLAADRGDDAALSAYVDVLDVGLAEARDNGVEFVAKELRELDPYSLLKVKQAA